MKKVLFSKKNKTIIISIIVAAILIIFFLNGGGKDRSENGLDDWRSYPYKIPNTDMRFPDVEGNHSADVTWISLGLRLDLVDENEELYITILYHNTYKEGIISRGENLHEFYREGDWDLKESRMDLTFQSEGIDSKDSLRGVKNEAFEYTYKGALKNDDLPFYTFNLTLVSKKPPATMYDGRMKMGSLYYRLYALTHCDVRGNLKIGNDSHQVEGIGWLENHWGSFRGMKWNWFAIWGEHNIELEIVDLFYGTQNKEYIMYVKPKGEVLTLDKLNIEIKEQKNGFAKEWEITSDEIDISLNITLDENKANYHSTYFVGLGNIDGRIKGKNLNTQIYIESTYHSS